MQLKEPIVVDIPETVDETYALAFREKRVQTTSGFLSERACKDALLELQQKWIEAAVDKLDSETIDQLIDVIGRKNSKNGVHTVSQWLEELTGLNPLLCALTLKQLPQWKSHLTGLLNKVKERLQ